MGENLARPLSLLIEVRDAETGANDARLIQETALRYRFGRRDDGEQDNPCQVELLRH